MLTKLLIHIKNIIFFKFVVYTLITIGLITTTTIFEKDFEQAKQTHQQFLGARQDIEFKIYLLANSKDNISQILTKYSKDNHPSKKTNSVMLFQKKLHKVSQMIGIQKPIMYNLISSCNYHDNRTYSGILGVECQIVDISFTTYSIEHLNQIQEALIEILPKTVIILEQYIDFVDVITPSIIKQLKNNENHNLINVKMKIMFRDVNYVGL